MNRFYDIKDIQSFLMDKQYMWNGKRCDGYGYDNEDFSVDMFEICDGIPVKLTTFNDETLYRVLDIGLTNFGIMETYDEGYDHPEIVTYLDKDLSTDWIEFLLKKNGKTYAEILSKTMNKLIERREDALQEELKPHQEKIEQIKAKYTKEINQYKEMQKLASTYIGSQPGEN